MKKIQVLLFSLFLITSFTYSQTKSAEERALEQTAKLKSELNLTATQESSIYEINYGIILKNDALRNSSYTEEVKTAALQQNKEARKSMIKGILTPEQYASFENKIEENKKANKKIRQKVKKEKDKKN
ncbi:MAG: hypothetical protein NT109_06625 [Flavobacteriia bacterium]|nr:hypothetical protein [Flavobacteriia bacterium]